MFYPHNTFDAETAKAWVGEGGMKQYFKAISKPKPPKPRGRPPKRKTRFNNAAPVPAPAVATFVDIENEQKKKKSRTNWGTGEHRIQRVLMELIGAACKGQVIKFNGDTICV